MFQSEMRHMIAQRQQKVVIVVMPRAKKQSRLLHQVAKVLPNFFRSIEGSSAVRRKIDFRRRIFARRRQRHNFHKFPGDDRTIHQHGQRYRSEMNVAAHLIRNM